MLKQMSLYIFQNMALSTALYARPRWIYITLREHSISIFIPAISKLSRNSIVFIRSFYLHENLQ